MATISKATAAHATLSGTTVDTVTITGGYGAVEVANRSGATTLYVTVDVGTAPTAPTAAGDDTFFVPPGTTLLIDTQKDGISGGTVVKIIGNGNDYSVTGVN